MQKKPVKRTAKAKAAPAAKTEKKAPEEAMETKPRAQTKAQPKPQPEAPEKKIRVNWKKKHDDLEESMKITYSAFSTMYENAVFEELKTFMPEEKAIEHMDRIVERFDRMLEGEE